MTSRSSLSAGLNAPVKRLAPITFPNDGRLLVIDPANFREARFWMVSDCRPSIRKGGVKLHFNHIAMVSTRWRAQNFV